MNTDGIAESFKSIVDKIAIIECEVAAEGSKALQDKIYDIAFHLSDSSKNLQAFNAKLVSLLEEWQSNIDAKIRQRFRAPRSKQTRLTRTHAKSVGSRLRVTFSDGSRIEEHYAADTFALALQRIGLDRVSSLGIIERNVPLVSEIVSAQHSQRRLDGKYICTHSGTPEKRETLERIAKKLGICLRVEII